MKICKFLSLFHVSNMVHIEAWYKMDSPKSFPCENIMGMTPIMGYLSVVINKPLSNPCTNCEQLTMTNCIFSSLRHCSRRRRHLPNIVFFISYVANGLFHILLKWSGSYIFVRLSATILCNTLMVLGIIFTSPGYCISLKKSIVSTSCVTVWMGCRNI